MTLQPLLQVLFLLTASTVVEAVFQSLPLVPHHVQEGRRRRLLTLIGENATRTEPRPRSQMSSDRSLRAQQVGALYQGYGTHYVDLWCGSSSPSAKR